MYIQRANEALIYDSFARSYISALLGPRRVGKSTLTAHYANTSSNATNVFLNMDLLDQRQHVENTQLQKIIQEQAQQRIGKGHKLRVIIDEAQKCPALFDQIKVLYDSYKGIDALKFILTGSGLLSLHRLSAESLAGRIEMYYLREFGLKEAAHLKLKKEIPETSVLDIACSSSFNSLEEEINNILPFRPILEKTLQELLIWGGLPEILQEDEVNLRMNYLRNYLQTYLEKDIRAISSINDINLYQKLLEIIAEQTGSVRQDKRIIDSLECSRDTIKKYRGYLMATLVYEELHPFINTSLKRLVKSPKGYLLNNGLISYLTSIDSLVVLENSGLIGMRFENWFLKELQIWLDRSYKRSSIYYWRTSGGSEVDFVVEKKPEVFPFEVSYSRRIQNKKINNLKKFLADYPKAKVAYYIYNGEYHYDSTNRICFLPAWVIG